LGGALVGERGNVVGVVSALLSVAAALALRGFRVRHEQACSLVRLTRRQDHAATIPRPLSRSLYARLGGGFEVEML
jgi:hypothetical protein